MRTLLMIAAACALAPSTLAISGVDEEIGVPYFTDYNPKSVNEEIALQSWAAVQDHRGVMFIANTSGVVEYDGVDWHLITLPGRSAARSLARDHEGRIWVGGQGTFGYLRIGPFGQMQYQSLGAFVPQEEERFADVWKTHAVDGRVYFQTFTQLFEWNGSDLRVFKPEGSFHMSFVVGTKVYVRDEGVGLKILVEQGLELVPGGERFATEKIYSMLDADAARTLVATRDQGLLLMTEEGFEPFAPELTDELVRAQVYSGAVLRDGSFALATLRGGAILIDPEGRLRHVLGREIGLQDSSVNDVYVDDRGGLWLALSRNLSRVEIPSAITVFTEVTGLVGPVQAVLRHGDELLAATTQGVYRLQREPESAVAPLTLPFFVPVKGIATQCWALIEAEGDALAATNDGVFRVIGDRSELLLDARALALLRSRSSPAIVYVGRQDGLSVLKMEGGRWRPSSRVEGIEDELRTLAEAGDGVLWLGGRYDGVIEATPPTMPGAPWHIARHSDSSGLPADAARVRVFEHRGVVYCATSMGLYRWRPEISAFAPATDFGDAFSRPDCWITLMRDDPGGGAWLVSGPGTGVGLARRSGNAPPEWLSAPFRTISPRSVWEIYPEPDGVVWFGTSDGLIRYDAKVGQAPTAGFSCLIRGIRSKGRPVVVFPEARTTPEGNPLSRIRLPYHSNDIRVRYAAPCPGIEEQIEYQSILHGFDPEWSSWSREVSRSYTNLPEGSYRFEVRARARGEELSSSASVDLAIMPPWHRTWWARIAYLVLGAGSIYLYTRLQVLRTQRRERSEAENGRRAFELRRARSIQRHMLPTAPPELDPFDIAAEQRTATEVGGDYYDFFVRSPGRLDVAIGDATGHGLGAGLMVAATRTALLTLGETDPRTVVTELSHVLRRVNLGSRLNMALTMLSLTVNDDATVSVEASGGGMSPMFILRSSGGCEEHIVSGVPLGALHAPEYHLHRLDLEPGDALVLMSDGVPERRHPQNGPLGYDGVRRFMLELAARRHDDLPSFPAQTILSALIAHSDDWAGHPHVDDDITVVVVGVLGRVVAAAP